MIREVLERHFFEFHTLWEQWHEHLLSSELNRNDLRAWESRMQGHLQALLLAGDDVRTLLEEGLVAGDPSTVSGAAYVLLCLARDDAANAVVQALTESEAELLDAIRLALCHGPLATIEQHLQELTVTGSVAVAAAASEALVAQAKISTAARLDEFIQNEDPNVRQMAWRIAGMLDAA